MNKMRAACGMDSGTGARFPVRRASALQSMGAAAWRYDTRMPNPGQGGAEVTNPRLWLQRHEEQAGEGPASTHSLGGQRVTAPDSHAGGRSRGTLAVPFSHYRQAAPSGGNHRHCAGWAQITTSPLRDGRVPPHPADVSEDTMSGSYREDEEQRRRRLSGREIRQERRAKERMHEWCFAGCTDGTDLEREAQECGGEA